jgi:starvation-inducible outer membrane lipoprotein
MSLSKFNSVLLGGGTLLLAACATIPPPEYSRNHPANSDAQAAPIEPTSVTLSSYRTGGVGSNGDAAPSDTPSGHAGHGAKSQPQRTPQEGRHDDQ